MFPTKSLRWKEGLKTNRKTMNKKDPKAVKVLAQYMFLTEQVGWKKILKLFGDEGEEAIES